MQNRISNKRRSGFTLTELLVALAITAGIITMLVTITAQAIDGYTISRNRVKAAREARSALDQLSRDLESLVVRSGNDFEWLWVATDGSPGPNGAQSPNATRAVFFTAATDRYNGQVGGNADQGGDVSTVGYRLLFRDPVVNSENPLFATFVLYRQLIDPDDTFTDLLAQSDLEGVYRQYESSETSGANFLCENIYELTITFLIQYQIDGQAITERVLVIDSGGGNSTQDFRVRGNQILLNRAAQDGLSSGRILSADIALTVLDDSTLDALRSGGLPTAAQERLLRKGSHHFAKTVVLPRL